MTDRPLTARPLHDAEEVHEVSTQLLEHARHQVLIFTRDLDAPIYNQSDWLGVLKRVILEHRKVKVRILVLNTDHAIKYGHRLIEMAQRLNSFIEIRIPRFEEGTFSGAFMITDDRGLVWRPNGSVYTGHFDPGGSRQIKELQALFHDLWEHAHPDPNLRRIHL